MRKCDLPNNNILIISPAFAPCTLVGAARMTSLAEYLQQNGYMVTVLSFGRWFFKDDLWVRNIPDGIKQIEIEESNQYIKLLKLKVIELLKEKTFAVCITSMGPFDTQKFLWKLCKRYRVPYILDYRDPWLLHSYYYTGQSIEIKIKRLISDLFYLRYEQISVRYAAKIVTVTEKNTDILKRRYKKYADKMHTILNGHENLSDNMKVTVKKHEEYIIGCIGKFLYYDERAAIELIRAVNELNEEGYKITIRHIGEETDDASGLLEQRDISTHYYKYLGKMGYKEAMDCLWAMDAALIIYRSKDGLGTKVFDYIGLNKPIIYYGILPSELAEFVGKFKNVVIADNKKTLKNGLRKFVDNSTKKLEDSPSGQYSRTRQNEKYEVLIKNIIKDRN